MLLKLAEDRRMAYFEGNTMSYRGMIKAIPGNDWDRKKRQWRIPIESIDEVKRIWPAINIDKDLLHMYKDIKQREEQALEAKTIDLGEVSTEVAGLKGELFPYQGKGKAFLDALGPGEGGILAFDMGLGKSLSSLATFLDWKNRGLVDHCLVICPAPLKYSTWAKEIEKWTELSYTVVDGDRPVAVEWDDGTVEKLKGKDLRGVQYMQWQFGTDIIVTNYELLLRDMDIVPKLDERWVVIMDECFPYDTDIMLSDGSTVKIGDIVENKLKCEVLSYNTALNKIERKSVVDWHKNKRKTRLVKVVLDNGAEIKMTENHKVYTKNRGYVEAKYLTGEDEVVIYENNKDL